MGNTRVKKEKAVKVPPIETWSVKRYGVAWNLNSALIPEFKDGISLDVENNENDGSFLLLGIYDGHSYWGWTDFDLAKKVQLPRFLAHNGASDIEKLRSWGFPVTQDNLLSDTFLMAHVLDSSRKQYALTKLAEIDLEIKYPSYEDICGKPVNKSYKPFYQQPLDLVIEKNAQDCYCTWLLNQKHQESLKGYPRTRDYFEQLEKPCAFIFHKMQERGVRIDRSYLLSLRETLEDKKSPIEQSIKNELGDVNLNSPKQLLEALHAKQIQPMLKNKPSTDKRALERFKGNRIVDLLLSYSELDTLLSSFVYPYLERNTEVVHPFFNQCGTRTGRPSCSNPNLLQIPKRTENGKLVRRMFIAREGMLFGDSDVRQIEPSVLAHLSKDENMCRMFNEDINFHTYTQERMAFNGDGGRDRAKVLNLSVGYRATPASVSSQLKCSWAQAEKEINDWWAMFPGLYDWEQKLIYECKKTGYFTTLLGRRIKVDGLDHGNRWRRESAERQLINNIAQASAQEIIKKAMIEVDKLGVSMLVQVYDELLFESPEELMNEEMASVLNCMENAVKLDVPLSVEFGIGKSWAEAK